MNKQYDMVKRFHVAVAEQMATKPTMLGNGGHNLTVNDLAQRLDMLVKEMKRAVSEGFGGDVLLRVAYVLEEQAEFLVAKTLEDQVDAQLDSMYFILGTMTKMGVKPEIPFDIVAGANLGKILPDGSVLRDPETNKVMKPPGWKDNFAPEEKLRQEIQRQIEES